MTKAKQASRKSKSAWRKNIDLQSVEDRLEKKRAAERVGVEAVDVDTESSSIFVEDRSGDPTSASLQSKKPKKGLKSLEILNNKQATGPSGLTSRVRKAVNNTASDGSSRVQANQQTRTSGGLTPEQKALRAGMSKKDIEKLRRMSGRQVKGAFGIVVQDEGPSSRGVEAVITPGTFDVWSQGRKAKEEAIDDVKGANGWLDAVQEREIQLPASYLDASKKSKSKALSIPDPGQSYNPAAEAHEMLLNRAIEDVIKEEERRVKEMEWKKSWDQGAKQARGKGEDQIEDLLGLKVGQGEVDNEGDGKEREDRVVGSNDEDSEHEIEGVTKEIKRKTKQQKAKAKKLKEEMRARVALKASKRSSSDLQSLRSLKKQLLAVETQKAALAERRREAREKRRGERVGVYKLPKRQEEVQLGEDLAEGLRLLKPEGNLLKDRLHSFQEHGIIEPKKRDALTKRRSKTTMRGKKEYETHAYKRFS